MTGWLVARIRLLMSAIVLTVVVSMAVCWAKIAQLASLFSTHANSPLPSVLWVIMLCGLVNVLLVLTAYFLLIQALRRKRDVERAMAEQNISLSSALIATDLYNARVTTLSDLIRFLQICQDISEASGVICRFAPALGAARGALYLCDTNNQLSLTTEWGLHESVRMFTPDDCWGIRRSQPYHRHPGNDPCCYHVAEAEQQCEYSCLPLTAHSEMVGLLYMVTESSDHSKRSFIETASEQIALALANLRLRDSLRTQSIHDPLTGLHNRRYLDEAGPRELSRARRAHMPIAAMMIDIDHFKNFNDHFGHEAGDEVLREVAKVLHNSVRDSDIACRYGGEEFLLLMSDCTQQFVMQRAEQLRTGIAQLQVQFQQRPLPPITVSIGIALYPEHADALDQLIDEADRALYRAKGSGRNRAMVAEVHLPDDLAASS